MTETYHADVSASMTSEVIELPPDPAHGPRIGGDHEHATPSERTSLRRSPPVARGLGREDRCALAKHAGAAAARYGQPRLRAGPGDRDAGGTLAMPDAPAPSAPRLVPLNRPFFPA